MISARNGVVQPEEGNTLDREQARIAKNCTVPGNVAASARNGVVQPEEGNTLDREQADLAMNRTVPGNVAASARSVGA